MLSNKSYIFFIVLLLNICNVCSAKYIPNDADLWVKYKDAKSLKEKSRLLMSIGNMYSSKGEGHLADSILQLAITIQVGESQNDSEGEMALYRWYFSKQISYGSNNDLDYAKSFELLAKSSQKDDYLYYAYRALSIVYIARNDLTTALAYADKAYYYANIINDGKLKAECLLLMGKSQQQNNKIDAFRNYMDALYIAEKIGNDSLIYEDYGALYDFFMLIKNYNKSIEYKQLQLSILKNRSIIDSPVLMKAYNELAGSLYERGSLRENWKITDQVIEFANRTGNEQLKNDAFAIYRSYLIEKGLFARLAEFYEKEYPAELSSMAKRNLPLYFRLMAFVEEADNKLDSAGYYYRMAEGELLQNPTDYIIPSNFYKRYGQFLLRQKDTVRAREKFEQSYQYALKARYFPYIIDATQYLDEINYRENNLAAAYNYQKLNRVYTDSEASVAKENELLLLEIDNENKQHELAAEREKMATERRHNIQDVVILMVITTLFIILVMLGSFKVPKIVIKSVGFVSFILFFEFIVMLTDAKVEGFTHGEPWKILLFKLLIIGVIAPIHHYTEHNLINYLYEHKLLDPEKMRLRPLIARLRKRVQSEESHQEH